MHRNIALALLPSGTAQDTPAVMARVLVAQAGSDELATVVLSRAGFTGAEIVAHKDEAERLAGDAWRRAALPNPQLDALTRALSTVLTAYPALTHPAEVA